MSAAKKRAPAKAHISEETAERLRLELAGAKAAAITAILALENKGVTGEVSFSLRRHVLNPIDWALTLLKE